jgi:hypothetical protein
MEEVSSKTQMAKIRNQKLKWQKSVTLKEGLWQPI